jgi:hypothetical protein
MHKFFILWVFFCISMTVNSQTMPNRDSSVIAFASDTQAPMWVETLWLRANNNRHATKMIFDDVAAVKPHSLFLLGDVVNLGYSNRQWKPIDRYLDGLRTGGIEVHAILGNHEVMGQAGRGQAKFQQRFPDHVTTGYIKIVDSVAVVLLNSNFNTLSETQNKKQVEWYVETLKQLDADSSVQFIITACHHSPFTNSKIVGSSSAVQQKIVPHFLSSKKSQLFLSGHSHNFEHFQVGGKDFMVIGGGGGLHQPLRSGLGILPDLAADYKPMFHYITVKRGDHELKITSHQLKTNFSGFDAGMTMGIKKFAEVNLATIQ